jgi:hypothetical protein
MAKVLHDALRLAGRHAHLTVTLMCWAVHASHKGDPQPLIDAAPCRYTREIADSPTGYTFRSLGRDYRRALNSWARRWPFRGRIEATAGQPQIPLPEDAS